MFLGIDWGRLVSLSFWTQNRPGDLSFKFEVVFVVILVICYGLYVVSKILQSKLMKQNNKIYAIYWSMMARMFLVIGVTFTILFFMRAEAVPYLGARYWLLLWAVWAITWLVYLVWYYYKKIPKLVKERIERLEKQKYL